MQGISYAVAAAILFGISTPLAKALTGELHPLLLAGLLYAGSGLGLASTLLIRRLASREAGAIAWPSLQSWPSFTAAIGLGGVAGPVLLMFGLQRTPASVASLLLTLESVFTALLAWFVFREHVDRRIALGMALIVAGSLALSWVPGQHDPLSLGALLIAGACLCWAADNNFTRKVSDSDAIAVACVKGVVAGAINLSLAAMMNLTLPTLGLPIAAAVIVGFLGYGISLAFFVLALRHLGAARTGAYFSIAPLIGVIVAIAFQHETIDTRLVLAALLIAWGVWLHLTERHEHAHMHEPLEHEHSHTHDSHHQHEHSQGWDGTEPHSHWHRHTALTHRHRHFPDTHHQHSHGAH